MKEAQERVRRFHESMRKAGATASIGEVGIPQLADAEAELRARLIVEEAIEAAAALIGDHGARMVAVDAMAKLKRRNCGSFAHVAQELADVCVVTLGTAVAAGIDLAPVFDEVMAANERKVGPGARVREDGKLLKPDGWVGPDVAAVLERQRKVQP